MTIGSSYLSIRLLTPNKKMEDVRRIIEAHIDLDSTVMSLLINRLRDLGVRSTADLIDVQVSDLSPDILLPVPARGLIRKFNEQFTSVSRDQASTLSSTPHNNTPVNQHTSSTQSSTPLTTSVDNASSWHTKFDMSAVVSLMQEGRQSRLTQQAAASLQADKQLSHAERSELVRCVVEIALKLCSTPSRSGLNYVAEKAVEWFAQLKDVIAGEVVGPGYISFRNQLENRISYLKRPINCHRRATAVRRRLSNDDETENLPQKRQIRDGYGCVDFMPVTMPEGEDEESLGKKQQTLKEQHASMSWTDGEVTELMKSTYILQRQDLVGPSPLTFSEVLSAWPFLTESKYILQHLERLLGCNIDSKLQAALTNKKQCFVDYFGTKSSSNQTLKTRYDQLRSEPAVGVVVPLLMAYFGEKEEILLNSFQVNIT